MTEQEIFDLLNQHEWKDVEFKEARTSVPKSAYESVSAFANTEGGHLVFGVKKDGSDFEVVGVIDVDKVQNDFITALRQKDKISCIIDVKEDLKTVSEKDLLIFYIPEANRSEKPVYLSGDMKRSFLRKGACDVKCSDAELKRLLSDASKDRYDGGTVDYDVAKCFNSKDIAWYRRQYEEKAGTRSYADLDDEEFLFQFGLIKETEAGRKPTVASILLFGQDGYLRGFLPRPIIDCQRYLYKSDALGIERWHDRTVCDYNLMQTWASIMEWYYRFAEIPFEVDPRTMQRKDQPVDYIPFREAIVNMLIHQDYSDHIRKPVIQHFSDLTRFWNPGDAFASVEDLLEPGEKETRNPLIVSAFRRIGFSENAGWGLRDVFKSWRGLGHVPPEIINDKPKKAFELILKQEILISKHQRRFQETIGVHLSEDEAAVFAFACKKLTPFSLSEIRAVINKPVSTCTDVANHLVNQLLLVKLADGFFELTPVMKQRLQAETQVEAHVEEQEAQVEAHVSLTSTEQKILFTLVENEKSARELIEAAGYKSRTGNFKRSLEKLLSEKLIQMTNPENPKASNQKYVISEHGFRLLKVWEESND